MEIIIAIFMAIFGLTSGDEAQHEWNQWSQEDQQSFYEEYVAPNDNSADAINAGEDSEIF